MTSLDAPMTRLAVETALLANGTNLLNFIGYIIKKVKEVRLFKDECLKLVNMSIELSLSYLEHQKDLAKIRSGKAFLEAIQKVYLLVIECSRSWNIYHIGWEVFCAGKIEKLMKALNKCQETFNTEILMNINSTSTSAAVSLITVKSELASIGTSVAEHQDERERFDRGLGDIHQEIVDSRSERQRFNQGVDDIRREIKDSRDERNSWLPAKLPTFPVIKAPDNRVNLSEESNGTGFTGHFDGQAAIFHGIGGFFPSRSRIIKIYQMIEEVAPPTMMQKLYGIFEQEGTEFLVMESGNSHQPLIDFVQSKTAQDLTMPQKLSFCYDLVSLVSILHGLDLVVKSITDVNILVQSLGGENPRPKLINLHYIRGRRDPSGREDIDWRFDAPETPKARTRSKMSDIWSLGIILMEIFTGALPFSTGPCSRNDYANIHHLPVTSTKPAASQNKTSELTTDQVTSVGSHVQLPFTSSRSRLPTAVTELVNSALAYDPMLRPSASKLAQSLFEILLREITVATNETTDQPVSTTGVDMGLVERVIQGAKAQREAEATARMKKKPLPCRKTLFEAQQIEELLSIAQQHTSEPVVLFAIGSAYLWGLCGVAERERPDTRGLPADVLGAEKALSYLKAASEQGYEASEELYHAHKVLARFYFEQISRKNKI